MIDLGNLGNWPMVRIQHSANGPCMCLSIFVSVCLCLLVRMCVSERVCVVSDLCYE